MEERGNDQERREREENKKKVNTNWWANRERKGKREDE